MRAALPREERDSPNWPRFAENLVTPIFEDKIQSSGLPRKQFQARKGDVLIWHGRLAHQGREPQAPGAERRALITHYSAITKRQDLPRHRQHNGQGWYFLLPDSKTA